MTTFVILLDASADLQEGARWFRRHAKTAEDAVAQLAADLGKDARFESATVIEATEAVVVSQEMRWEAHHVEGG